MELCLTHTFSDPPVPVTAEEALAEGAAQRDKILFVEQQVCVIADADTGSF